MDDFKSYSLSRQTPRRAVIRRLLMAGLFLVLLAGGFLYLISSEESVDQATVPPKPADSAPQSEQPEKLVVPLDLPGQQKEGRRTKPEPQPISFIASAQAEELPAETAFPEPAVEPEAEVEEPEPAVPTRLVEHKIKSGDSLSSIFKKHSLSANLLHRIVHSSKTAKQLTDIRPGETLQLELDQDDNLHRLRLVHNKIRSLEITPDQDSFSAIELNRDVETRTAHTSGTIQSSLYVAAQESGLSENLIMELANIFGWDIDFALEIRAGDRFTVIYEEDYLDGERLRDGPILAAEFVNRGRSYRALRYVDETGRADYFTPEGRSMRKAFLRAPVDFRRISSRFTRERYHPVLGKKRPPSRRRLRRQDRHPDQIGR